jgi:hypothetical protein
MGFLINSSVHKYIQNRPNLLACQVPIEESNHKCLSRDSYVNCVNLFEFDDAELVEKRDPVSARARTQIKKAVNNSKTIEKRYKKLILGEA